MKVFKAIRIGLAVSKARALNRAGESARASDHLERALSGIGLPDCPSEVLLTLAQVKSAASLFSESDEVIGILTNKIGRSVSNPEYSYIALYADALTKFNRGVPWSTAVEQARPRTASNAPPHLRKNFPLEA